MDLARIYNRDPVILVFPDDGLSHHPAEAIRRRNEPRLTWLASSGHDMCSSCSLRGVNSVSVQMMAERVPARVARRRCRVRIDQGHLLVLSRNELSILVEPADTGRTPQPEPQLDIWSELQ